MENELEDLWRREIPDPFDSTIDPLAQDPGLTGIILI